MFSYAGAVSISDRNRFDQTIRHPHNRSKDDRQTQLAQIETAIDDLPLDLISPANTEVVDETSLNSMAVNLSLDHLGKYIDTVDEITS